MILFWIFFLFAGKFYRYILMRLDYLKIVITLALLFLAKLKLNKVLNFEE